MVATEKPKKKRVSKKSKLSWRKHTDIRDVEEFLEDKRLEERLGKPLSEKTDTELFQVDVKPTQQKLTTKQARRLKIKQRLPKCFSMLQPHTQVPDPVVKRNRVRTKDERKSIFVKRKEEKRLKDGILRPREWQSFKDMRDYLDKKREKKATLDFLRDMWDIVEGDGDRLQSDAWIDDETKQHTLRGMGRTPKAIPKSLTKKNSILPPVEVPHPGMSYNPSFSDHQDLLRTVASKEGKIIKEEKHIARVTSGIFRRVSVAEKDNSWLVEMSEGLLNLPDEKETNLDEPGDYKAVNPPVKNKKKNLKQRRVIEEQKILKRTQLLSKREKKKVADIYKLKFLKKRIEKTDEKSAITQKNRLAVKLQKTKQAKRLGPMKFEEEEIDFNMPQDIGGSLRSIKKEGNLLLNRFKSLQKRNILQPTTRRTHKQAKTKRFKKPGHKEDWKSTVAGVTV